MACATANTLFPNLSLGFHFLLDISFTAFRVSSTLPAQNRPPLVSGIFLCLVAWLNSLLVTSLHRLKKYLALSDIRADYFPKAVFKVSLWLGPILSPPALSFLTVYPSNNHSAFLQPYLLCILDFHVVANSPVSPSVLLSSTYPVLKVCLFCFPRHLSCFALKFLFPPFIFHSPCSVILSFPSPLPSDLIFPCLNSDLLFSCCLYPTSHFYYSGTLV